MNVILQLLLGMALPVAPVFVAWALISLDMWVYARQRKDRNR